MASNGAFEKGFGILTTQEQIEGIGQFGWNVLREDLSLPALVLKKPKMEHNLRWMAEFVHQYGVQLAPHGKTTMAPKLFQRQLDAGAWGITLATAHQCATAHAHGVRRILMANELVGKANLELISSIIAGGATFYTLVDSVALVDQLGSFFQGKGQQLRVLVELGIEGGRTGTRTEAQAQEVVDAVTRWNGTLLLCGVEVYEGVCKDEAAVRSYLESAVAITRELKQAGSFAPGEQVILSGAGSAWYDVVADVFASVKDEVEVVLRPGCYATSDAGIYRVAQQDISERNGVAHKVNEQLHGTLQSAIEVWAYVQSVPEPGLAIIGLGKRDAAFDAGLPTPVWHFHPGSQDKPTPAPSTWSTTKLMDQHAYLAIPEGADIKVGDMIGFEISHPCLTFDKWRYFTLVDEHYNVLEAIPTFF